MLDVANDLKVNVPGTRTDTDIAHAIRQALEWDVFVPHDKIHSTVSNGWVTLEGTVERTSQREDAERAVRNLFGVRGITNMIALKDTSPVTGDVRKAIEQTLERRAEREARRIKVDVHDGVVTLTGAVHTWAERKSVLAAVRFTPGVLSIDDRLRLEPV